MPATPFSATARREGEVNIIDLAGDIDREAQPALDAAYAEAQGHGPVILNFERTSYINSTGIAVIVGLLARARSERRELKAFGLTPHYREIFQITRLADFMTIFDNEPAAMAAQGREGN
ncbi:MAG TPA: STAS domain-containing protein [Acidimicrobiia bacterium]|jgi:anti-anti-sigma factor